MKTISERIKEALEIRDMKQTDLVKLTGITKGALSSYISGAYEPKQRNIYKIAQALNVNEAWLMGYDVSMDKEKINNTIHSQTTSMINYNLEQYIQNLGFNIIGDEAEGYLILDTKEAEYEINLSDLESFEDTTESFIKFKLSEIMNKSKKLNKNSNVVELPKKEKQIWEEEGKEHLMPIACHNDNLTDEENNRMNDIINNYMKNKK
ncbi:helix-turn-helix domain-containing protein [Clostridium tertium]|uniref:helix-turn-helix domain-containing protein n=1 Tax=Clostridium tertium TaxID=1559 RepID=UPI00202857A1|nr:helix-turn-helix transcriptional regulator [Clostridium tertium]